MILATAGVVILAPLLAKILPRWLTRRSLRALEIDDIDEMTGHEFERYVAALLTHQGFETTVTKGSGDLGVDIIARRQDHSVAVQCKRRADDSSRTAVSDAVAGKHHYQCEAAMVVTNQHFTPGAHQLAESTECQLIDREALAHWITDFHRQAKRS
jgi:restriction system protein